MKKYLIGMGVVVLAAIIVAAVARSNNQKTVSTTDENSSSSVEFTSETQKLAQKISFLYPEKLDTKFFSIYYLGEREDGPQPEYAVTSGPLTCAAEPERQLYDVGEKRVINASEYCIKSTQNAGAGHTETNYAYSSLLDGKAVTIYFGIRSRISCQSYEDPAVIADCKKEGDGFEKYLDQTVDQIFKSMQFIK
jgi:hypothetical protein